MTRVGQSCGPVSGKWAKVVRETLKMNAVFMQ